ncbi:MAG TPA: ATP-binding cassette domain-containing protein, partial [Spirochaetia bacterium]|nr:ATP-binding cassette domain-containing protein [Spirochaetia bacterium]
MAIVQLSNIKKTYLMGKVTVPALSGVSINIEGGDFVAIAGPSGSGKTTILNIIGLIDTPSEGKLTIDRKDVHALRRHEITHMRQKTLGFIFQSFNLLSGLNVFENVELPLLIGRSPLSRKSRKEWVGQLLAEVGLADRMTHKPRELSGGQQQ